MSVFTECWLRRKAGPDVRPTLPPPARTEPTTLPRPARRRQSRLPRPQQRRAGTADDLDMENPERRSVVIDGGVGNVSETGSVVITPRESTTFTATAEGPGARQGEHARHSRHPEGGRRRDVDRYDNLRKRLKTAGSRTSSLPTTRAELSANPGRSGTERQWLRQYPGRNDDH